jgi:hypothetical protein
MLFIFRPVCSQYSLSTFVWVSVPSYLSYDIINIPSCIIFLLQYGSGFWFMKLTKMNILIRDSFLFSYDPLFDLLSCICSNFVFYLIYTW